MNNSSKISSQDLKLPYKIIIPVFALVWLSMIGVAAFGLKTLFTPHELNSEKPVNTSISKPLPTVPEPPIETKIQLLEETVDKSEQSVLPFHILIMILLACSGGSLLMTYALRHLVTDKPSKIKIKEPKKPNLQKINHAVTPKTNISKKYPQKNISQNASTAIAVKTDNQPTVTVVSPHESTPVETKESTLAEILDLRKRRSLISLMQDN